MIRIDKYPKKRDIARMVLRKSLKFSNFAAYIN